MNSGERVGRIASRVAGVLAVSVIAVAIVLPAGSAAAIKRSVSPTRPGTDNASPVKGDVAQGSVNAGGGTVKETKAEPTTLTTSLEGAGQSGADVVVPEGTVVTATSTLAGPNAASARGTASYKIYSDSSCTYEVNWTGPRGIRTGAQSRAIRLAPGTYYWQATYSGDAKDIPSSSVCGATIETVQGSPAVAPCGTVSGEMHTSAEGGHLSVREALSTDLAAPQRLVAWWSGKHRLRLTHLLDASCVAKLKVSYFRGMGEAKLDGVPGYTVHFTIRVSKNGEEAVRVRVRNATHELVLRLDGDPDPGSEVIA